MASASSIVRKGDSQSLLLLFFSLFDNLTYDCASGKNYQGHPTTFYSLIQIRAENEYSKLFAVITTPADVLSFEQNFFWSFFNRCLLNKWSSYFNVGSPTPMGLMDPQISIPTNKNIIWYSLESVFGVFFATKNTFFDILGKKETIKVFSYLVKDEELINYLLQENIVENLIFDIISISKFTGVERANTFLCLNKTVNIQSSLKIYSQRKLLPSLYFFERRIVGEEEIPNYILEPLSPALETSPGNHSVVYNANYHIFEKTKGSFKSENQRNNQTFIFKRYGCKPKIVMQIILPDIKHNEASFFEILFEYLLITIIEKYKILLLNTFSQSESDPTPFFGAILSEFSVSIRPYKSANRNDNATLSILHLERTLDKSKDSTEETNNELEIATRIENTKNIFRWTIYSMKNLKIFTDESYILPEIIQEIHAKIGPAFRSLKFYFAFNRYIHSNFQNTDKGHSLEEESFRSLDLSLETLKKNIGSFKEVFFIRLKDEGTSSQSEEPDVHQAEKSQITVTPDEQRAHSSPNEGIESLLSEINPILKIIDQIFSEFSSNRIQDLNLRSSARTQGQSPSNYSEAKTSRAQEKNNNYDLVNYFLEKETESIENKFILKEWAKIQLSIENIKMDAFSFKFFCFLRYLLFIDHIKVWNFHPLDVNFSLLDGVHQYRSLLDLIFYTKFGEAKKNISFMMAPTYKIIHEDKDILLEAILMSYNKNKEFLEKDLDRIDSSENWHLSIFNPYREGDSEHIPITSILPGFLACLPTASPFSIFKEINKYFEELQRDILANKEEAVRKKKENLLSVLTNIRSFFRVGKISKNFIFISRCFYNNFVERFTKDLEVIDRILIARLREILFNFKQTKNGVYSDRFEFEEVRTDHIKENKERGGEIQTSSDLLFGYDANAPFGGLVDTYGIIPGTTSILSSKMSVWYFDSFAYDNTRNSERFKRILEGMGKREKENYLRLLTDSIVINFVVPFRTLLEDANTLLRETSETERLSLQELVYLVAVLSSSNCLHPKIESKTKTSKFKLSFIFYNLNNVSHFLIRIKRDWDGKIRETPLEFFQAFRKKIEFALSQDNTYRETQDHLMAIHNYGENNLFDDIDEVFISRQNILFIPNVVSKLVHPGHSSHRNNKKRTKRYLDKKTVIAQFFRLNYGKSIVSVCKEIESDYVGRVGDDKIRDLLMQIEAAIAEKTSR